MYMQYKFNTYFKRQYLTIDVIYWFLFDRLYKAKDVAGTALILNSLEMKVPLMFHFLGNDDDDVSGAISQYAHDYITLLKQTGPMTQTQQTNVKVGDATLHIFLFSVYCCPS